MNKRLGTLAAAVALSAVAAISSGGSQPLPPSPRPCSSTGTNRTPCIQPRQVPPVPAPLAPRAGLNTTSFR